MMGVVGPPLLGERLRFSFIASLVLLLSFFVTLPLLVLVLLGEGGELLGYVIVLVNILEIPFMLLVLYGFVLLGRFRGFGLLVYPVLLLALVYVFFIVVDSVGVWLGWSGGGFFELLGLVYFLVSGCLSVVFSVGLLQLRDVVGWLSSVLGVLFFVQGLFGVLFALFSFFDSVVGLFFYLGGFILYVFVYPVMAAFFFKARRVYGGGVGGAV